MNTAFAPFAAAASRAAIPELRGYDLLFVLTALAFELLIIAILIAEKQQRLRLVRVLGTIWALLALPFALVLAHMLTLETDRWTLLSFAMVFLYIGVEIVLDFVLKIPFRERLALHIPYIVLEYAALFGLIHIAFTIGPMWGYLISIVFWLLLAVVIYVYRDQITGRRRGGHAAGT
jgi:hypothetical protein